MNERLKELRKYLGISQDAFGQRIGMSGGGISLLEKGKRNFTEQVIKSICREFGIDYIWLTTGEGEMFIESDDDLFETIDRIMAGENELHKKLIKWCATSLDEEDLQRLEKKIDSFITEFSKKNN
ncbi:MAG: helix-turn-helix domain-containing protein [Lachnospiraceae bacterium]|nr:helix-turn-helix domain-containing protein [Lachnospiraceae bacterium]